MNQKIVKYLQDNKDKYSKEDLITELEKFGYSSENIQTAVVSVYPQRDMQKSNSGVVVLSWISFGMMIIASLVGLHVYFRWFGEGSFVLVAVPVFLLLVGTLLIMSVAGILFSNSNTKAGNVNKITIVYLLYIAGTGLALLTINTTAAGDRNEWVNVSLPFVSVIAGAISVIGTIVVGVIIIKVAIQGASSGKKLPRNARRHAAVIMVIAGIIFLVEILTVIVISPQTLHDNIWKREAHVAEKSLNRMKRRSEIAREEVNKCPSIKQKIMFMDRVLNINDEDWKTDKNINTKEDCDGVREYGYNGYNKYQSPSGEDIIEDIIVKIDAADSSDYSDYKKTLRFVKRECVYPKKIVKEYSTDKGKIILYGMNVVYFPENKKNIRVEYYSNYMDEEKIVSIGDALQSFVNKNIQ